MTRPLAIAIALIVATLPGRVLARPRVALPPFDGDPGGEVQDAVADALDGAFAIVGPKEVNRTADKLGLEGKYSDRDLKKLASELDADAVVQGEVSSRHGHHLLHFRLFVHGKKVRGFKVEFASMKSKKFREALRNKMMAKIDEAGEGDRDSRKHGDDDDDAKSDRKHKGDGDDKIAKRHGDDDGDGETKHEGGDDDHKHGDDDAKRHDHDDDQASDDDDHHKAKKRTASGDDEGGDEVHAHTETTPSAPARFANHAAIRVDAGASLITRKLTFVSRSFTDGMGPPPGFTQNMGGGARVDGEVYPLAFGNPNSVVAGIGLAGLYDQTLGFAVSNSNQPGMRFPVTERQWAVGARFRIAFGTKATSPTVTLGADYGHRTFKINRSGLMSGLVIDVPDVDYAGLDPGLQIRIPLAPQVALVFGGGALLLTKAGAITTNAQYGQAKVTGGDAMAGVDIVLANHYAIRLAAEAAQVGFAFTGSGAMANNRDGDPTSVDVGGASDRYIGAAATFGVLY
jgi:hypothetical protein